MRGGIDPAAALLVIGTRRLFRTERRIHSFSNASERLTRISYCF
jgi:hypothetical protein